MSASTATPARGGRVGVRDVAQLAGVSTQTVSRVLNDSPSLREETRARVLDAMAQLDYRPNNAARALGTAQTRTLGVVATDVTLYGPSARDRRAGHVRPATPGGGSPRRTPTPTTRRPSRPRVSHVLGPGRRRHRAGRARTRGRGTPCWPARSDVPIVIMHGGPVDRQAEGDGAGRRAPGRRSAIGASARLGGPPDWLEELSRRAGYDAALAAHGLAPGPSWVGDWSAEAGAAGRAAEVAAAVRSPDGPTAIVVANDQMALGLMTGAARAAAWRCPATLSVVGLRRQPGRRATTARR